MAWRNFPISGLENLQGEITDFSLLNQLSNNWAMSNPTSKCTFLNIRANTLVADSWLCGDSTNGIQLKKTSGSQFYWYTQARLNNTNVLTSTSEFCQKDYDSGSNKVFLTIYCCVDDETQKAYFFAIYCVQWSDNTRSWNCGYAYTNYMNNATVYQIVTQFPIITYNWQSVPSISGKNGILSLVTLDSESVNDGEPVSGAAISVFDQAPSNDNNIKNLADTYGGGEESSAVDVTVKYKVTLPPGGSFSTLKIVAKKDSIPEDASDGDKIVDISPSKTKKTVTGLDENSLYYFKIFGEDTNSNTSESDEKHITTSGDEGWSFDYTGSIQTFVAPKTGIYQLETWGAQGGDATDGTLTARGGYGAYSKGEVLLTQGDKLYIGVGGQDGFNGGTGYNYIKWLDSYVFDEIGEKELTQLSDFSLIPSSVISASSEASANLSSYIPTEPIILGDITYSMDHKATTYTKFIDNDYLEIGAGKVTRSGTDYHVFQIKNKLDDYVFSSGYENFVWDSGFYPNFVQTYQLGVVLDKENQRAYLIRYSYAYNGGPSANGKYLYAYGMKTQNTGVDVLWETFKNLG